MMVMLRSLLNKTRLDMISVFDLREKGYMDVMYFRIHEIDQLFFFFNTF